MWFLIIGLIRCESRVLSGFMTRVKTHAKIVRTRFVYITGVMTMKYVGRKESLEKARWYLDRLIAEVE